MPGLAEMHGRFALLSVWPFASGRSPYPRPSATMAAADFSLRGVSPTPRPPFGSEARSPQVRPIGCPRTSAGSTTSPLYDRKSFAVWCPLALRLDRLISSFCSSPRGSCSPLLSAGCSRSPPYGSLGSLRSTSQRTFTSKSMVMLGTHLRQCCRYCLGTIASGSRSGPRARLSRERAVTGATPNAVTAVSSNSSVVLGNHQRVSPRAQNLRTIKPNPLADGA